MARILVVEDNPTMAEGIRDVLELAGHDVSLAADGGEGLRVLAQEVPGLIISDVMMPGMDGFAFYQAVRANPAWVFIPFVFLTAKGQDEDIRFGMRLGADDYLVKPYDREDLLATVDSKLARARAISLAAASEMEELKRSITRMLGHELRTPLTWIQGYTELLLGDAEHITPEELNRSLQSIKAGSDRLARLVEDAVLVTTLGTGQAREEFSLMSRVETNLLAQLEQVVALMRPTAERQQVQLELRTAGQPAPVVLAPRFFSEALVRLIDNSIKFARREDTPSCAIVAVENWADEVHISVADNGLGISPDQLERAFGPFEQVDRERHEQQGMGLGLAVARGVIELHGGRMWAESEVGVGTTVHIALPHAPLPSAADL